MSDDPEETLREKMNQAESAFAREYWAEIKRLADDVREKIKSGEYDADGADRYIHETLDGHQWVIYTSFNYWVLITSKNDDTLYEEGMIDQKAGWAQNLSAAAYYAMERDVREELGDLEELVKEAEESEEDEDETQDQE